MQLPTSFLSLKKEIDFKERTVQAMSSLETEIKAMHSLGSRLRSNVNDSLLLMMKSECIEETKQFACEYDDLVRLLDIVRSAEMLLYNLSVKVDSARYLQEFVNIMDSAMRSVIVIKKDMSHMVPRVDTALDNICQSINEMKLSLGIEKQKRDYELPVAAPQVIFELPCITSMRSANICAINLTTFTTEVHTPI